MKSFYLILALFCTAFSLQAQTEFAPLGAKWTYGISGNLWFIEEPTTLEVIDTQTINGKKMKKLLSVGYKGCGAFSEWIYEEDGKVYQYINQKSYLLYDFKAKAGDSWKIIFFTSISNRVDSALVRVDSVSTINTASGMKKVQYVSGVKVPNTIKYDGNIGRYIIEGIGFNDYLFPSFGLCDAAPRGVRCYSENGITENFVNYDCNKTINWLDNKEQDATSVLSVSPNPSTGNLVVQMNELPSNTATWQLYDLQGKQVFLQLLQSNNTSFDLPDFLPQGIYFWRVMDGQEKLAQGKLVMTH